MLEKPPPPSRGKPRADCLVTPHWRWGETKGENPSYSVPWSSHSGLARWQNLACTRQCIWVSKGKTSSSPSSKPTTCACCTLPAERSRNLKSRTLRPKTMNIPSYSPVLWSSPLAKLLHIHSTDCRAAALSRAKTSFFFKIKLNPQSKPPWFLSLANICWMADHVRRSLEPICCQRAESSHSANAASADRVLHDVFFFCVESRTVQHSVTPKLGLLMYWVRTTPLVKIC